MLFHAEDQILLDVQFHVRVDEAGANSQAWLSLFLSINTLFSVLFIIVVTKLDVLRSWKIRSVEMKLKVSTKRGNLPSNLFFVEKENLKSSDLKM